MTNNARLERWKLSLLELGPGDPLLDAKDAWTCLELPGVDALRLHAAIARAGAGCSFGIEPGLDASIDTGWLRAALPGPELERRLVRMRRAAGARLAEGGVHALWLGLGALVWCDGAGQTRRAPLWLQPVDLERADGGRLRLAIADAIEPRFNHTLGEYLRRELDVLIEPGELAALLEAAEGIAVTRPGWRVERGAWLGVFAFDKLELWRDLEACGDALLANPLVAQLAGATTVFAQPSAEAAGAVAAPAARADLLAPLDADASQLAAVAAAGAGASFVLQGPPGAGKSQTIANLIVHCVGQGKSVLFVSDKIAALEVVQARLAAVGLGDFCLELHSHKTGRAHVLGQLGRVFERAFRPGSGPSGDDSRLGELRAALDAHAAALHRVGPFGRSVHAVLGRLVELRTTPRAAIADRDATGLDHATFERRRIAVAALAAAAVPVEPVATHPWRTSALGAWEDAELGRARALAALDEAGGAAEELAHALDEVAGLAPGLIGHTRAQLRALGALAALAAASPRPGVELLTALRTPREDELGEQLALLRARGGGTIETPRDPLTFLLLAGRHRQLRAEVEAELGAGVAELDAPALWAQLRRWTHSVAPLRYMALRAVRNELRAVALPGRLESDEAMQTALEAVIAERAVRTALLAAAEPARRWFGALGGDPLALDLPAIEGAVGWAAELRRAFDAVEVRGGDAGRAAAWRALVAQVAAGVDADAAGLGVLARLADAVERWLPALAGLAAATGVADAQLGVGPDHLAALREQVEHLRHAIDSLGDWVAFHGARAAALAAGVDPAVGAIERGDLGAAELGEAWERATLLAWVDAELAESPALARFHGAAHHAHVAAFADLDRASLALIRSRALVRFSERVPRAPRPGGGSGPARREPLTGELDAELELFAAELKQRTRAPRELFAALPNLLPRLAPCLVMSPLAVAQHLAAPAGGPQFDLVVFDEASQLPTAEALGALARARAAVVVGDSRQLPPMRLAGAGVGADAEALDRLTRDGAAHHEPDNLLADSLAARLSELRLTSHYRSRHEDLIAFSNERYYDDRLQVFPAVHGSPDLGIAWRHVAGAGGGAPAWGPAQNRAEAEAVVAEVVARLRDPAQCSRSIGVVTFARAQQELIEDLIDEARAADSALDAVMGLIGAGAGNTEPVIVKHVEAIQGDERDVVLLSIGSGPDAGGPPAFNFGPLSRPGGERGLNVAITRAREQLVVFSSFAPEELLAGEGPATPAGVRDLAALLAYARSRPAPRERPPASPITDAIARALAERGWLVRHQIGAGPYKIDLAVVDPNDPERHVLAIEHDGLAYAGAGRDRAGAAGVVPGARDRDRLRAQILTQLGWRLHRIWSLDWWTDPEHEIQRAHGAIITAIASSRRAAAPVKARAQGSRPARARPKAVAIPPLATSLAASRAAPPPAEASAPVLAAGSGPTPVEPAYEGNTTPLRLARGAIAIGPYTAAAVPAGRRAPDDLFAPRHLAEVGKLVEQVLAAEAPMHIDLLARRVGAYFGIGRVTQRVTDQVRVALAGRGRFGDERDVVWRLDQDPTGVPPVRVASTELASGRREIHQIPLCEVAAAARIVVERASHIATPDLVRDAARLLGFARITEPVVARVGEGVRLAQARALIRVDDDKATVILD